MELISTPHTSSWRAQGKLHHTPCLDLITCFIDVFNGVVSATKLKQDLNAECSSLVRKQQRYHLTLFIAQLGNRNGII